jgi:hypothetical protein
MITIIHGDDLAKSREYFLQEKDKSKEAISFDKDLTLSELTQITEGGSLFLTPKDIFIEGFFASRKTNTSEFKDLASFIKNKGNEFNFMFWEGKTLEKSHINVFKDANVKIFNLPQSLFLFLDSIRPRNPKNINLFHDTLKNSHEDIVFYMLIRQFRLLIALSNSSSETIDEVKRLAPWQKSKLEKQASLFSSKELLLIHNDLLQIDSNQKIGRLGMSLVQSIDIFLIKL